MADAEHPQIYLITPPQFELSSFSNDLSAVHPKPPTILAAQQTTYARSATPAKSP